MSEQSTNEEQGMVSRFGPVEVDWPRTIGYYGGIALAVAFELIEPPVGIFIASIPLIKMLSRPKLAAPVRFASEVLQGASIPLNGDAEASVRIHSEESDGQDGQSGEGGQDGQAHNGHDGKAVARGRSRRGRRRTEHD